MIQCGTFDDVYAYEKMRRPSNGSGPPSPSTAKLGRHKKAFSVSANDCAPTSARLGGKKAMSFRWITRQDGSSTPEKSRRMESAGGSVSTTTAATTKKSSAKEPPSRKVGFVDILLGYHSLLQASPSSPATFQRKQLYPTVGFLRNNL